MKRLLTLFMCFSLSCYASARTGQTGEQLHDTCQSDHGACIHYIQGVIDGTNTAFAWQDSTFRYACTPKGITGDQLKDVVLLSLSENPEERHNSAASLVLNALLDAYPCP